MAFPATGRTRIEDAAESAKPCMGTPAEQCCPTRATCTFYAPGLGSPGCMPRPCQTCRAGTPTMARQRADTPTRYPVTALVPHVSAHRRCAPERRGDRARPARARSWKRKRTRRRHQCNPRHHHHLQPSSSPFSTTHLINHHRRRHLHHRHRH